LTKTDSTGTTSYTWDFENRLTSVVLPGSGGTVSFKYDPYGRRIQKSSILGTTNYLYDGANILEEIDGAGNVLTRYVQSLGVDQPLAETRGSTTSYYEADGLGSITSLSNSSGALANTYTYDSFGNLTASTGTLTNPVRYTGREFDTETGLHFYRARYYDPNAGRFVSEDPIQFMSGIDFYTYVSNSPQNFTDALGLSQNDVNTILNQAQNLTNQMTANGQRISPGSLNNILSSLQRLFGSKNPYLGCGEQADRVANALQFPKVPYDDHWTCTVVQEGWHQFGVAMSSNPNDPNIIFDPWKNQFFTTPKVTWPLGP